MKRHPFLPWTKLALCAMLTVSFGLAATTTNASAPPTSAVKITLMPSREQGVAGSALGITARVENVSDHTIYFTPGSVSLTVPPEVDPYGPYDRSHFFGDIPDIDPLTPNYNSTVVPIASGSTVSVFWRLSKQSPLHVISQFFQNLSFVPGKYTLSVLFGYWDRPDGPTGEQIPSRTQPAEIQEFIGAPESIILFGAVLGGLFAFLLVWKENPSLYSGWGKNVFGALSATLLSVIVTILLARLADTEFIIRVTVNDLWGAIAVGFIGAASGPVILQKFTNKLRGISPPHPKDDENRTTTIAAKSPNDVSGTTRAA